MWFLVLLLLSQIFKADCDVKLGHALFDSRLVKLHAVNYDTIPELRYTKPKDRYITKFQFVNEYFKETPLTIDQVLKKNKDNQRPYYVSRRSRTKLNSPKREENPMSEEEKKRTLSSIVTYGYAFDESKCQVINTNKRVICGYNKNRGEIPKEAPIIEMSNGCKIRNGRIECGYTKKPALRLGFKTKALPRNKLNLLIESEKNTDAVTQKNTFSKISQRSATNFQYEFTTESVSKLRTGSSHATVLQNIYIKNLEFMASSRNTKIPLTNTLSIPNSPASLSWMSSSKASSRFSRSLKYETNFKYNLTTDHETSSIELPTSPFLSSTSNFNNITNTTPQPTTSKVRLGKVNLPISLPVKTIFSSSSKVVNGMTPLSVTKVKHDESLPTETSQKVTLPTTFNKNEHTSVLLHTDPKDHQSVKNYKLSSKDYRFIARVKKVLKNEAIENGCPYCGNKPFIKKYLRQSGTTLRTPTKLMTICAEIKDRIVCYPIKSKQQLPIDRK